MITLFLCYRQKIFNHVGKHNTTKYEGTDDCSLTAVTDDLFMHSALPPATKHI